MAIRHSGTQALRKRLVIWALGEHSRGTWVLSQSDTRPPVALMHLGTTETLGYLGTESTWTLGALYLVDSI